MKSIIFILFISNYLFSQKIIDIGKSLVKKDAITLSNEKVIKDEDGFYRRVSATYTPDGRLIIFDHGNSQFNVYDRNYKKVHQFGKEGSGPGEIQKNFIWLIRATNDYIYAQQWNEVAIYKMDGTLVKEIKGRKYFQRSRIQIIDNKIVAILPDIKTIKIAKAVFSATGELLEEVKIKDSVKESAFKDGFNSQAYRNILLEPRNHFTLNNKIYSTDPVDYEIFVKNINRKPLYTLKRSFEKQKYDPKKMWFNQKRPGQTKEAAARNAGMASVWNSVYQGNQTPITSVIGSYKNHIFYNLSSPENTVHIDVISQENKLYTQLTFSEEELSYIEISQDKLIKYCNNDDDGPYIKIYDIILN